ncbi:MAG: hypothetical protein II938_04400 [Alphaproteobacteria bacterium]|nr:hypothetical protein [Alphaproteobacteria bacterium]
MAEQIKTEDELTYVKRDGVYYMSDGRAYTTKQVVAVAGACLMIAAAGIGWFGCAVYAAGRSLAKYSKKAPAVAQKQAVNPALTNNTHFVSSER